MKTDEIRQMTIEELEQALDDKIEELQNLRFQHATHQLNDPTKLTQARRDIARMRTILSEYSKEISKPITSELADAAVEKSEDE
ncbi:50S ribosomal protein L29 [candidate division KSB1 bacterium]|nr:50S ribosomal protein L29 [candidate division KSB1 bacterium]